MTVKVIGVVNPKGGSGKSTIATNVAFALQKQGHNVLLVDNDPQGSTRDWHEQSNGDCLNVIGLDRVTIAEDIKKNIALNNSLEYILIDGSPQATRLSAACVTASDLVIVPVQPSPYDVWATYDLLEVIKARRAAVNPDLKAYFCISRIIQNTSIGKEVKKALEELEIPTMKNHTVQRVAYTECVEKGLTVFHGKDEKAISEIEAIKDEILEILT